MINKIIGITIILLGVIVLPLFSQDGISVSIYDLPEPFVFSKERHFKNGRSSTLSLVVEPLFGEDNNPGISVGRWDISIKSGSSNLESSHSNIPINSIWAKAMPSRYFRGTGKVYLSPYFQTLAYSKPRFSGDETALINVKLKAVGGEAFLQGQGEYSSELFITIMMD